MDIKDQKILVVGLARTKVIGVGRRTCRDKTVSDASQDFKEIFSGRLA
jgi:hypothetical protein